MQSRDRLDEIIKKFYDKAGMGGLLDARGMAEESFRHGVERGVATAPYMMDGRSYIVQPGPVGEKHVCTLLCMTARGHQPDRRKGQRRTGSERRAIRWFKGECIPIWQGNSNMFWNDDRRAEKNRRKP